MLFAFQLCKEFLFVLNDNFNSRCLLTIMILFFLFHAQIIIMRTTHYAIFLMFARTPFNLNKKLSVETYQLNYFRSVEQDYFRRFKLFNHPFCYTQMNHLLIHSDICYTRLLSSQQRHQPYNINYNFLFLLSFFTPDPSR